MRGEAGATHPAWRRHAVHILLFFVTLCVLFLFFEGIFRLFYAAHIGLFPRYHTDLRCGDFTLRRLRPHAVFHHTTVQGSWEFRTNAQGFRNDADFSYAKRPGVMRIVCLGDSHTEGFEVRQEMTFTETLGRYLAKHGVPAEVYNMGVSGYSTAEEVLLLENEAIKYRPDYVVVGFFANDYEDNIRTHLFEIRDGKLALAGKEYIPGVRVLNVINSCYLFRKLSEDSYFYSFFFNAVWESFKWRSREKAREEYAIATKDERGAHEITLTRLLLERMDLFCKTHHMGLIVVDIPEAQSGDYRNSLDHETEKELMAKGVDVIDSEAAFGSYRGIAEFHVPRGALHISEFSHLIIGMEVGKRILAGKERVGGNGT